MSPFTLGVVSNCWSHLLPASSLAEQCRRAPALGHGCVELRQRALGACEEVVQGDDRPWPVPLALEELARSLPGLRFNLAVEAPFMTRTLAPDDPYLRRCAGAARALGGEPPVLRLVDLSPAPALLAPAQTEELGRSAAALARELWRDGIRLALENSKQPVAALLAVIDAAARSLQGDVPVPQVCWDPANQALQHLQGEDPVATAAAFTPDRLFEFHFKQTESGAVLPDVRDGLLDWRRIAAALKTAGCRGPALFEIPSGPDIWERLERSTAYVKPLLEE